MSATLEKCRCQHCDQHIEFESSNAGESITCPSCGLETVLFVPGAQSTPKPPMPAPPQRDEDSIKRVILWFADTLAEIANGIVRLLSDLAHALVMLLAVVLFFVGMSLVIGGCSAESSEASRTDGSAIRQNVYVLQYCAGFILMGLSPLVFAAERFVMWLKQNGTQPAKK